MALWVRRRMQMDKSLTYAYNGNVLALITDEWRCAWVLYEGNKPVQERSRLADGRVSVGRITPTMRMIVCFRVKTDLSPENNSIADGKVYITTILM